MRMEFSLNIRLTLSNITLSGVPTKLSENRDQPGEETQIGSPLPNEGWEKVVVTELLSMDELVKLDPFKEDEAYLIEKQVDMLKKIISEGVNFKEIFAIKVADIIFSIGAIVIIVNVAMGNIRLTPLAIIFVTFLLAMPYVSTFLFKSSRLMHKSLKLLMRSQRAAAFGKAYRSEYALRLKEEDLKKILKVGSIDAEDSKGRLYRVVTDTDLKSNNYVIIYRSDEPLNKDF